MSLKYEPASSLTSQTGGAGVQAELGVQTEGGGRSACSSGAGERDGDCACVCVCVCEREREREREREARFLMSEASL